MRTHVDSEAARRFGRQAPAPSKVAFVVNYDRFFLTHRATWGVALIESGAEVAVIAGEGGAAQDLKELGFQVHSIPTLRQDLNPFAALKALSQILSALRLFGPDVVFLSGNAAYTVGWPAALVFRCALFVRIVAGVGTALVEERSGSIGSRVVALGLRLSGRLSNVWTLFQTAHDQAVFNQRGFAQTEKSTIIPSTGIDVDKWSPLPSREPSSTPTVLFASRLFAEKGVYDFQRLAQKAQSWPFPCSFQLAGAPDFGAKSTVTYSELNDWHSSGVLEYVGEQDDMLALLRRADVLVLPSRHPEGTPKVLIEAAAVGLPVVVYDHPGCRAVVEHDVTGVVVDAGDEKALAEAVRNLVHDERKRRELGSNARSLAITRFGIDTVLGQVYRVLMEPQKGQRRQ